MLRHVYRDFSDLSKSEQLALFEAMKHSSWKVIKGRGQ